MKKLNKKGFSLVELIIVIAIMAVLIGVLAPTYIGQVAKSKISTDIQNAQEVATAIAVEIASHDASVLSDSYVEVDAATHTGNVMVPTSKVDPTYVYVAKYANNQVYVGLQKKTGTGLTGDVVEIYPVDNTASASPTSWKHN